MKNSSKVRLESRETNLGHDLCTSVELLNETRRTSTMRVIYKEV